MQLKCQLNHQSLRILSPINSNKNYYYLKNYKLSYIKICILQRREGGGGEEVLTQHNYLF